MEKNVDMKYLGSKLFLAITFCVGINFGSSVANGDIFNIFNNCYRAFLNKPSKEEEVDKSIERSILLALEKIKAEYTSIDLTEKEGQTDLMRAAEKGKVNRVLESARNHTLQLGLSEMGAQLVFSVYLNEVDSNGMTALMHAAKNGHKKAVVTLVRVPALVDRKDKDDMTASMHAAANGHHDIAEMLAKDGEELLRELGGTSYLFNEETP